MKLFDARAPHPKRVRIFLFEKGIEVPADVLDFQQGQQRSPEFLALNSLGEAPVLQLDDGRVLTESTAICRYLESVYPQPPLMGVDAFDQALVEMWSRRLELRLARSIGDVALHTFPFFAGKVEQNADYAQSQARAARQHWAWLDAELSDGRPFIAGARFSHADIIGMFTVVLADLMDLGPAADLRHARAWMDRLKDRPSFDA